MATGTTMHRAAPDADRKRWSRALSDGFRRMKRGPLSAQYDRAVSTLAKKVESGRVKLFEHIVILAHNLFLRGATQHDVEAFGHAYLAVVRSWYAEGQPMPDLAALAKAELDAQCMADPHQWDMLRSVTPKGLADCEAASSVHLLQLQRFVGGLRAHLYATDRQRVA